MAMPGTVSVLALDAVVPFDLSIPGQVFGMVTDATGRPSYDVRVCTVDGSAVSTTAGYQVVPEGDLATALNADTVVVAGSHLPGLLELGRLPDTVGEALADAATSTRLVSLCTGAFALAAAGVLDGRHATTHWYYADRFRALHPHVELDANLLFTEDTGVFTSAGGAAAVDLCLHLIRADEGSDAANHVARLCVVPSWRDGGQAQFIERPAVHADEASTARTRDWMSQHLDRPVTLAELADHAAMSVRTFTRRFRQETGQTPFEWLTSRRVDHARRLLEISDLDIDQIATRSGFGTGTALRQHFRDSVRISPSEYRRAFRGTPATTSRAGGSSGRLRP